ncbi:MAG TPA: BlaI/MecI/CopY family transcriptional regulator [Tessaracoccus flavescens]|uniref:BlaI/MecI/CopY family transcriptional regulator n=1 Tax=Tessaracoccus flavescens TaxID=399497 RepID=A0A921EQG7_9ACTN|nr:BlaI/MecI/CopY family transcriptional regulator [Tessaracoccus flavescens]
MPSRGELEQRVMELLWESDEPKSVADVHAVLTAERELAYTTVMTVLDRLAKKDLVERELVNRAWQYRARSPQGEVIAAEMLAMIENVPTAVRLAALRQVCSRLNEDERTQLSSSI